MNTNNEKETKVKITKRSKDFSQWYNDVISAADMVDYSPVRGCMVIKPNGYAIWENIKKILDTKFKETGHRNAYFPVFIPESFLRREAEHVEGFSPELAIVTHAGGKELEEKLVVRPTSETIIYDSYAKWIQSWRDLPVLLNQWCNVVRWEMRTKLFLRTTEFLWQEGHTAHPTHQEAEAEVLKILDIYEEFSQNYLAIPVIKGVKSENEKFAGALRTYAVEAMMQDTKALQCGTSHDLGQNFSKAFNIKYLDRKGKEQFVWQTSWGVSTRLIGAIVMTHGDDNGIILPPKIAPLQVVFVPIWKNNKEKKETIAVAKKLVERLPDISCHIDQRDLRPAWRYYDWERQGVPVRVEIGPRDVSTKEVVVVRRDNGAKENVKQSKIDNHLTATLEKIQKDLFNRAKKFQKENTYEIEDWNDFKKTLADKGGFLNVWWCGDSDCELKIKEETKATVRCLPLKVSSRSGKCVHCGKHAKQKVIFSLNY